MTTIELITAIVGKQKADKAEWFYDHDDLIFAVDNTILYRVPCEDRDHHTLTNVRLIWVYDMFKQICQGSAITSLSNLQDDPKFCAMLDLKSKDGISYYYVMDGMTYIGRIPIFSGLLKVNKGDRVDINIYTFNNEYYLNEIIVTKKKINRPVYHYLLTLRDN